MSIHFNPGYHDITKAIIEISFGTWKEIKETS